MGKACMGEMRNAFRVLLVKVKGKDHLGDPWID
jgi:hypothetical protein